MAQASGTKAKPFGGIAAREGTGPLYRFTEANDGSFVMPDPDYVTGLHFPLMNLFGMKCSITPDFKGDICSGFNNYYTIPVVTEDLHRCNNSRNFWISVAGHRPWSATGVSAFANAHKWEAKESAVVEAGIGWFAATRTNKNLGLKVKATAFVPASEEFVEVVMMEVENYARKRVTFVPTYATPIFGRSADNLRDHRHVTTMFSEIGYHKHGVVVKARIHHDETGHTPNPTSYVGLGFSEKGAAPKHIWAYMRDFVGEGGSMLNPEAVFKGRAAPVSSPDREGGEEAVFAARFSPVTLAKGRKARFVILHCITDNRRDIARFARTYGSFEKAARALESTRRSWKRISDSVCFNTENKAFDNWMRWVAYQPFCRKVYGNSHLLDLGYGRGGRGWRDLWSDLLALFLIDPESTRTDIVNNFLGVRIDGSNATIVGTKPGEFKADRNNIPRTWSDHGTWPLFVLDFYIHQTGDLNILTREIPYWKDALVGRSKGRDPKFAESQGNRQKTRGGAVYMGSILEHVILQQLSSFYNVGEHNNILLEGADWNDCYDMARTRGESVCFYNWYGWNLRRISKLILELDRRGMKKIPILAEALMLLDRLPGRARVNYSSPSAKQNRLRAYFDTVEHSVGGKKIMVGSTELAADLRNKADHVFEHIRTKEWLKTKEGEEYFNGHYDDHSRRVDGDNRLGARMDLTSQVFPTMFGVATDEQVKKIYHAARTYLRHPKIGGLRLTTDFRELKLDFGRITAFIYGFKEHGSIWNQMNVMYMYALYRRNAVREGYSVFKDTLRLATNSAQARCFPNLPSYFDKNGRGSYQYLTGSATWVTLGLVTQVFGVRGELGDLCLNPKLMKEQFGARGVAEVCCNFAGKALRVRYINRKKLNWNEYAITAVRVNGREIVAGNRAPQPLVIVKKSALVPACRRAINTVDVVLG